MAEKREVVEAPPMGAPMYMLSFGDMMTNLLCFFILLCAFAHERKVGFISDGIGAFRQALLAHGLPGVLKSDTLPIDLGANRVLFKPSKSVMPRLLVNKDGRIKDANRDALRRVIRQALLKESTTDISVSFIFMPGRASLTEKHRQALRQIAPQLAGGNFKIRIRGFAWREGVPMKDAWALAFDRAYNVMRYLREAANIEPARLETQGFGPPAKGSRGGSTQLTWGRRSVVISLVQQS